MDKVANQLLILKYQMVGLQQMDRAFKTRWPKMVAELEATIKEGNEVFGIDDDIGRKEWIDSYNHLDYENVPQ